MMKTLTVIASLFLGAASAGCIDRDDAATPPVLPPIGDDGVDGKDDGFGVVLVERKLVEESRPPEHVMQDEHYIYYLLFTEADEAASPQTRTLVRAAKAGGLPERIASLQVSYVVGAALAGSYIYVLADQRLSRIAKTGGSLQPIAGFTSPRAIAADSGAAYVAEYVVDGENSFEQIVRIAAGSATPIVLSRATHVVSLAVDDSHVYWLDETDPNPLTGCGPHHGFARKVGKTGGATTTLVSSIPCPMALALDATAVYLTHAAPTGTLVIRASKLTGLTETVGSSIGSEIALDANHVFWISLAGHLVRSAKWIPLPVVVALDVGGGLRADPWAVFYWRRNQATAGFALYRLGVM